MISLLFTLCWVLRMKRLFLIQRCWNLRLIKISTYLVNHRYWLRTLKTSFMAHKFKSFIIIFYFKTKHYTLTDSKIAWPFWINQSYRPKDRIGNTTHLGFLGFMFFFRFSGFFLFLLIFSGFYGIFSRFLILIYFFLWI